VRHTGMFTLRATPTSCALRTFRLANHAAYTATATCHCIETRRHSEMRWRI